MSHVVGMRGWIDIGSDVNWEDHGGMWARRAKDGSWYGIRFDRLPEDCGGGFSCQVKRLSPGTLDRPDARETVARSCDVPDNACEESWVWAMFSYGFGAPLESFEGKSRPNWIRAKARRYAETCMRDAALLAERLDRPCNAVGSTAAEYGNGDVYSGILRGVMNGDSKCELMLKLGVK